ncbi:D-alanine--poly(phosphoribitol) ligase [Streptomyces sp. bgisy034]|uniref:D-alanine--poly(phosphoribitol) ligase n=1 Tax=Streptomyces sp. bgisy034 TaxID=3413774 RepID=UPI003EBD45C6
MTHTTSESDTALIRLPRSLAPEESARPALVGERTVTYGELQAGVAAVVSGLLGIDAVVGDRVAIWMDKQPRYVEAILGALQAGCAYVPLDGGQPAGRVRTILADCEPVALFTDRHHWELLAGLRLPDSIRTVVVSQGPADGPPCPLPTAGVARARVETWEGFAAGAARHIVFLPTVDRDDLASILYTSGSTGTPKGVRISYRNLANFIRWARAELLVGPDDVFANHASFNFDLSTFDLFMALSAGARVWIVADDRTRDTGALAAGIREHGVTVWYSVPSVLHLLTASGALTPGTARSLRYVLFAGEVFPIRQLRALAELLPTGTQLYNLYGPTETNVCTYHRVSPEDLTRVEPVPIGRPVTGARVSVVDEDGRVLDGQDVFGELVVEGDCVTAGYWRRESEPAAADHRKGRHATGDLVSYEQGELVYRGRKDRMVKLSGYRVELGEIEAAVLRHPDISSAAVVVDTQSDDRRIALYYTLSTAGQGPGLIAIKRHCARYLPRYMLPQTATRLESLPRNANGKTDYRRLCETAGAARPARALPGK